MGVGRILALSLSFLLQFGAWADACKDALAPQSIPNNDIEVLLEQYLALNLVFNGRDSKDQEKQFILRIYANSTHPQREDLFQMIYRARFQTLDTAFLRVGTGLDKHDPLTGFSLRSVPIRRFLRNVGYNDARISAIPDAQVEWIVEQMHRLTPDQRLIVLRQAYLKFKEDEHFAFPELLVTLAKRVEDPTIQELLKDSNILFQSENLIGRDRYERLKVGELQRRIEQRMVEPTTRERLTYLYRWVNNYDLEYKLLAWTAGIFTFLGLVPFAPFLMATVPATLIAMGAVPWTVGWFRSRPAYNRVYPLDEKREELNRSLELRAHTEGLNPIIDRIIQVGAMQPVSTAAPTQRAAIPTASPAATPLNTSGSQQPTTSPSPGPLAALTKEQLLAQLSRIQPIEEIVTPREFNAESFLAPWARFRTFADTMKHNLVGRDELITIIEYALLGDHHNVALLGPAGTGKTTLARSLSHILDRANPSRSVMFQMPLNPETSRSELEGPLSYRGIQQDQYVRLVENSLFNFDLAFLDEFLDYPRIRTLLTGLEEGTLYQGGQIVRGRLKTTIAATNRYITEIYEALKGNNAQAPQDRFAWLYLVPGELSTVQENLRLQRLRPERMPELYLQDIQALKLLTNRVTIPLNLQLRLNYLFELLKADAAETENISRNQHLDILKRGQRPETPPYKSSRTFTLRSARRAVAILKVVAAHDWLSKGAVGPLVAKPEHLDLMSGYFRLGGPSGTFLQRLIDSSHNPLDKQQYQIVDTERTRVVNAQARITSEIDRHPIAQKLTEIARRVLEQNLTIESMSSQQLHELVRIKRQIDQWRVSFESGSNEDGIIRPEWVELPRLINELNQVLERLGISG